MNKIKYFREKATLTQIQLAKTMNVAQSTVAMWENGSNFPRASILPKLAEILGCSIDDLYGEETA